VLDRLAADQKSALLERLHQLQSDTNVLTRDYRIQDSLSQWPPPGSEGAESPYVRALTLAGLEGDIVLRCRTKYETRLWFVLNALGHFGFATDQTIAEILLRGVHKIGDIDAIAEGLHRLINEVNGREW
jgi:hypothetical protein